MQIPAGPNQIAQAYQGNPAALQANIQKDQQQKPNIMPDFAKLLALGTVTSEKDNAAKAQALQQLQGLMAQSQTGKPPTVFEQVQRKAAQMRMGLGQVEQPQPEPQGLPAALQEQEQSEPAQGIDQLPADFEFAGGGIVAFQSGEEVSSEKELEERRKAAMYRLATSGDPEAEAKYRLATGYEPPAQAPAPTPAPAVATPPKPAGGIAESPLVKTSAPATPTAQAPTPKSPTITDQEYQDALKILQSPTNKASYAKEINSRTDLTPEEKRSMIARFDNGWAQWEKVKKQWEAENLPQPKLPAPKPAAPAATKPAPAATAPAAPQQGIKQLAEPSEPVDPMEAALSKSIISSLGQKPEDVYKEGVERNRATVGLDALLQEKEGRIAATEALLKKQQAGRLPLWVTQLQEFSRANPRAGLGAQLGLSGAGAEKARAEYEAEDRAFNDKIVGLKDAVLQARIEGRYKDAANGEAAIKDLTANRRQAEASGTSLLNTKERAEATRQAAKDAALSRQQVAEGYRIQQQAALDERIRQNRERERLEQQKYLADLSKFAEAEERKWQADLEKSPEYKNLALLKIAAQRRLLSRDAEKREKAEVELGKINEAIIELARKRREAVGTTPNPPAANNKSKASKPEVIKLD